MKKVNARLLEAVTRNFESSKIGHKVRVSSTRYSTMESLFVRLLCNTRLPNLNKTNY